MHSPLAEHLCVAPRCFCITSLLTAFVPPTLQPLKNPPPGGPASSMARACFGRAWFWVMWCCSSLVPRRLAGATCFRPCSSPGRCCPTWGSLLKRPQFYLLSLSGVKRRMVCLIVRDSSGIACVPCRLMHGIRELAGSIAFLPNFVMYATGVVTETNGDFADTHRWVFRQYSPLKTVHALLERLSQLTGACRQWGDSQSATAFSTFPPCLFVCHLPTQCRPPLLRFAGNNLILISRLKTFGPTATPVLQTTDNPPDIMAAGGPEQQVC